MTTRLFAAAWRECVLCCESCDSALKSSLVLYHGYTLTRSQGAHAKPVTGMVSSTSSLLSFNFAPAPTSLLVLARLDSITASKHQTSSPASPIPPRIASPRSFFFPSMLVHSPSARRYLLVLGGSRGTTVLVHVL